jgi:hypothetical protein
MIEEVWSKRKHNNQLKMEIKTAGSGVCTAATLDQFLFLCSSSAGIDSYFSLLSLNACTVFACLSNYKLTN